MHLNTYKRLNKLRAWIFKAYEPYIDAPESVLNIFKWSQISHKPYVRCITISHQL